MVGAGFMPSSARIAVSSASSFSRTAATAPFRSASEADPADAAPVVEILGHEARGASNSRAGYPLTFGAVGAQTRSMG
jgi:hypothetical protein